MRSENAVMYGFCGGSVNYTLSGGWEEECMKSLEG